LKKVYLLPVTCLGQQLGEGLTSAPGIVLYLKHQLEQENRLSTTQATLRNNVENDGMMVGTSTQRPAEISQHHDANGSRQAFLPKGCAAR